MRSTEDHKSYIIFSVRFLRFLVKFRILILEWNTYLLQLYGLEILIFII